MSMFIKGMEMPKNCKDCQLLAWNGGYYCMASQTVIKALRIQSRRDDCPLVEIPTPHGRLIDADNIYVDGEGYFWFSENEAPTVIEAEGET